MTRKEAIELKLRIDSTCYPNVAYKGARFSPEVIFEIPTEKEEELTGLCKFETLNAELIKAAIKELPSSGDMECCKIEVKMTGVAFLVEFGRRNEFFGFKMSGWYLTSITHLR